jgi:hypothetical protein
MPASPTSTKSGASRDEVEHLLLRRSDVKWIPLFQACCLNFEKTLVQLFGENVSLAKELSFALQFAKLDIDQVLAIPKFDIPEQIETLDARLRAELPEEQLSDLEYRFKVIYTLDNVSKGSAGIQFIKPGTEEAKEIKNVLLKYKLADEEYPYKPGPIAKLVSQATGTHFSVNNHTQAWHLYKIRPRKGAKQPDNTNKEFCIYHPAHKDYTYSEKWLSLLIEKVTNNAEFDKIKSVKL